jgi:Domain of unknown function (DUF4386)
MNDLQKTEAERGVLRWGGLAGILGGLLLILVFVIVAVFIGQDPAQPQAVVTKFPDIRAAQTVEDSLYLLVMMLWIIHFLALYVALRGTSLAPALFGSVLGILGLVVVAAGALPHVAHVTISNLFQAPGATTQDQATLVLMWQATAAIFNALLVVGLVLLPIGLIALGVAMLRSRAFGKVFGGVSVGLGVVGIVAATVLLVDPLSSITVVGVFTLIVFNLVLGWKTYSLSRAPLSRQAPSAAPAMPARLGR